MTRDELKQMIYKARTLAEVNEAGTQLEAWLDEHPGDREMHGLAEMLVMTESALE